MGMGRCVPCLHWLRDFLCLLPSPISPRCEGVALTPDIWGGIKAARAARAAAREARYGQPAAAPSAVEIDGVEGILRAARSIAAFEAEEGLQRPAVYVHRQLRRRACEADKERRHVGRCLLCAFQHASCCRVQSTRIVIDGAGFGRWRLFRADDPRIDDPASRAYIFLARANDADFGGGLHTCETKRHAACRPIRCKISCSAQ